MEIIFLFIAILCFSIQFIFSKYYQKNTTTGMLSGVWFSFLYSVVLLLSFLVLSGFKIHISKSALIWAVIYACSSVLCTICSIMAMQRGSVGRVSMFTLSGGLTLPFIAGVLMWDEHMNIMKFIGCLLIVSSIVYQNIKKKTAKSNKLLMLLYICVFITNGFISIASKAHQIAIDRVPTNNYLFLCFLFVSIIALSVIVILSRRKGGEVISKERKSYLVLLSIIGFALMNGIGNFFSLTASKGLDASFQFPVLSASIVLLTAFLAYVFYKEKPTKEDVVSLTMNLFGILCFLFVI